MPVTADEKFEQKKSGLTVALSGVNHGLQQQSADPNNGIGVSLSLNHQQSKSETKYQHDIVSGSTLSAGNNVSVTATGKIRAITTAVISSLPEARLSPVMTPA